MKEKIKVPEGMLAAAMEKCRKGTTVHHTCRSALEAAIHWLKDELEQMKKGTPETLSTFHSGYNTAVNDVCRMFLAPPDPELKVLWDLLQSAPGEDDERDRQIIEAFRRGIRHALLGRAGDSAEAAPEPQSAHDGFI